MQEIHIDIDIQVSEAEHLAVSSFVKTMMQMMDVAIESKPGADFKFKITGAHPEATTSVSEGRHPLADKIGL